jgi:16S rRNA (guanine527-N7)-methyltransferase
VKRNMDALELVRLQAAAWGLRLEGNRLARLEGFARSLGSYEEANVIGTREVRKILLDHVLDSLSCFLFEPLQVAERLADVGTGGGLPGVPIKIVAPRTEVTLVESVAKKARFLQRAIDGLSLQDTTVLNARVEEASRTAEHRAAYDIATARAVARLSVVAEYCVPLLRVGGHVVSMKGRLGDEELSEGEKAAKTLGAKVSTLIPVPRLSERGEKDRCLVILEKVEDTPAKYPRKVGVPAKNPLGVV